MSTVTHTSKDPEEHARRLNELHKRIAGETPTTFYRAVRYIYLQCLDELGSMFPPKTGRASMGLYHGETMNMLGQNKAEIVNLAASQDGYRFGYIVHQGRGPLTAPTKLNSKPAYVWITQDDTPRPQTKDQWAVASKVGVVARAKHLPARAPKPWRKNVIDRNRETVKKFFGDMKVRMFR